MRPTTWIVCTLLLSPWLLATPVNAGGWLGITVQPPDGVQIGEILKDGPADKAGLTRRDVVIKVDGKPITSLQHFLATMANATPGKEMQLTIIRKGEEKNIPITPDDSRDHASRVADGHPLEPMELPPHSRNWQYPEPWPANPMPTQDPRADPMPGQRPPPATMEPPSVSERTKLPPPNETPPAVWLGVAPELSPQGVLLSRIAPGGPGERAGLKEGDILISLNGQSVSSPMAIARILRSYRPGDLVEVTINRKNQMIDTQAQLAAPPTEAP
ncbi:MAG: PDZ domain-containing protein [Magnetococcales bacterium]|nr:PDZ domain-containing protein [Magnetococcales bacterium]